MGKTYKRNKGFKKDRRDQNFKRSKKFKKFNQHIDHKPVYEDEPCKVALYPLPEASVQVAPDEGADCKLNINPLVTIPPLTTAEAATCRTNPNGINIKLSF